MWLEEINLGSYRQIFKENGVNGEYLEGMSMFTTEQILRFIRRCHMKWGDFITLCKELRRIKGIYIFCLSKFGEYFCYQHFFNSTVLKVWELFPTSCIIFLASKHYIMHQVSMKHKYFVYSHQITSCIQVISFVILAKYPILFLFGTITQVIQEQCLLHVNWQNRKADNDGLDLSLYVYM